MEQTTGNFPICFYTLNYNLAGRVQWEFKGPLIHPSTPPSRTMTFDNDNRLATLNSTNVTIDAAGNMTYGPGTNNTFGTYAYDPRNRLTNTDGISYGYDLANNRVSLTNGTNVSVYVIDPQSSQVLMRMTGGVTNYYVYGQGLLYEVDETATTTTVLYYHPDARGSTVALTDASGNLTDQFEYSPYGTTTYHFGTNTTPFLYNGQFGVQTDPNGLLYMRARYYNPYICRFINADPSGFGGGLNFYAFANGNPISETDPFGLGAQGDSGGYSWIGQVSAIPSGILPSGPYSYLTGSGIVSDATATVANFGSLLGNTGSQFLNAFTTTAGAAVQGIDAVGEQFGAHDISTPVAIFFGGGIVGDLSAAGELAAEETTAGSTFYHYTTNPNLAGQGLNVGSGVTSVGDLNASEAMFQLGIDPPTHVYPVTLQNPLGYISINTGAPIRNGIPIWSVEVPTPAGSVGLPTLVPRAP